MHWRVENHHLLSSKRAGLSNGDGAVLVDWTVTACSLTVGPEPVSGSDPTILVRIHGIEPRSKSVSDKGRRRITNVEKF